MELPTSLDDPRIPGHKLDTGVIFIKRLWGENKMELIQLTSRDVAKIWDVIKVYSPNFTPVDTNPVENKNDDSSSRYYKKKN